MIVVFKSGKLPERKDKHRKPLLPNLRVADVNGSLFILYHIFIVTKYMVVNYIPFITIQ